MFSGKNTREKLKTKIGRGKGENRAHYIKGLGGDER